MKNKKMKHLNIALPLLAASLCLITSCKNDDIEFPDSGTSSVYFSQQTPIRTLVMGDDVYDTTWDNAHKSRIMVAWGGGYETRHDVTVNLAVDPSLCDGLKFADGTAVTPMPDSYYKLASTTATIESGKVLGGVEVDYTDAFFNDPLSLTTHYVIPVKIVSQEGADTVLESKNYQLYAVKYINRWDGNWLCSGTDEINDNGQTSTVERTDEYVENYDVMTLSSKSYTQVTYPITTTVKIDGADTQLSCTLLLSFHDDNTCTVTTETPGCTATGSGTYTIDGAKKAWGDKDRDLIKLDYTVTYQYQPTAGGAAVTKQIHTKEQLIARDRGSKFETFEVTK